MTDEHNPAQADLELPRQWQEEWTVPEMPTDLSQRVISRAREAAVIHPPLVVTGNRSATMVATGASVFAAAAAAAALVISVSRPATPEASPAAPIAAAPELMPAGEAATAGTPMVWPVDVDPDQLGHLVIDAVPRDARVLVDGNVLAGPSPFVATNLVSGPHEIVVEHEGFETWTKTIDVPKAQLQLPIELSPLAAGADAPPPHEAQDPASEAAQGVAKVVGGLDRDIARRIVRAHIDEVRSCYDEGLRRNPKLEGRIEVRFEVASTGVVATARLIDDTLADPKVGACVVAAVRHWKFPRPSDGERVVVTYPFMFSPG